MPLGETFLLGGSVLGIAAVTWATFVSVSYLELRNKINDQISAGEEPYELRSESKRSRKAPPSKKKKSGRK